MISRERLMQLEGDAKKAGAHHLAKTLRTQLIMQQAIGQMNAPLLETAEAIRAENTIRHCSICSAPMMGGLTLKDRCARCDRAVKFASVQAYECKENIKALKGWLAVMTAASFAGWLIWAIADCAK